MRITKEELEKIAGLLGFSQAVLYQQTLEKVKAELSSLVQSEEEPVEEIKNLFDTVNSLTEKDWELSVNDIIQDQTITSATHAKSFYPDSLVAYFFGPEEEALVNQIKQIYTNITGKKPEEKVYHTAGELNADKDIPQLIKNKFSEKSYSSCKFIRLKFDSKQQYDKFMNSIPEETKNRFNPETASQVDSSYSSPRARR